MCVEECASYSDCILSQLPYQICSAQYVYLVVEGGHLQCWIFNAQCHVFVCVTGGHYLQYQIYSAHCVCLKGTY